MAHYIAEKLLAHKQAVGDAKAALEAELVDLLLKFWKHRAYFPRGSRPFEEYEPVLRALASLDPDRSDGRYFNYSFFEENKDVAKGVPGGWIDIAKAFDRGARAIVNFSIGQAALAARKPGDAWYSAAKVLAEDTDRDLVVIKYVTEGTKEEDEKIDPAKYARDRFSKIREDLVRMVGGAGVVLKLIDDELEKPDSAPIKSNNANPNVVSRRRKGKASLKGKVSPRKKSNKKAHKVRAPSRKKASR